MKAKGEISRTGTTNEVAVGILSSRQLDHRDRQTQRLESTGETLRRALTGLVEVLVKDEVNLTTG